MNKTLTLPSQKKIFCFLSYCNKHRWAQWGTHLWISGAAITGDTEQSTVAHLVSAKVRRHRLSKLPAKVKPLQQEAYKIC